MLRGALGLLLDLRNYAQRPYTQNGVTLLYVSSTAYVKYLYFFLRPLFVSGSQSESESDSCMPLCGRFSYTRFPFFRRDGIGEHAACTRNIKIILEPKSLQFFLHLDNIENDSPVS